MARFLVLHPIVGSAAETTYEPISPTFGEAPRCPRCGIYIGMRRWLPPYRVRLRSFGRQAGDIAFGTGDALLLSDRFVDAWRKDELQGLGDVEPVEFAAIAPVSACDDLPRFNHAVAKREGASIDRERTHVVRKGPEECILCGGPAVVEAILGIGIAEDSWNGAEMFVPWGLNGIIVVTERVAALASRYDLANVTVTPVAEYVWNPLERTAC